MQNSFRRNFRPISGRMFQIAIPIAISGLVTQAQMLIDTAFLARYTMILPGGTVLSGSDILSAVGNVFFPYIVGLSFLWSITTGTVILVSQRLGAKEPANAKRFALASLKFNMLLSLLVYIFWLLFAENVFTLLGVRQPILDLCLVYTRFISLELFYLGISTTVGAIFQGMGLTRPEMFVGILRSLLHVAFDYLLIFGHFGFPEMGVAGAGLASSLSGLIAACILLAVFFRMKNLPFKPGLKETLTASFNDYRTVLRVGLPVGVEDMLWNSGNLVLAYLLNILNQEAVGIYRLVYQIEVTPIFFYIGIARAVTTLVGNKTGARDLTSARHVGLIGSLFTAACCCLFSFSFLAFPKSILAIFTADPVLIEKSVPLLMITAITMIPRSVNIISGHAIRGYGDTLWMLATQIFGVIFIVSLTYVLMFPAGLGMVGMFLSMFADETLRGIINTVRFYHGEKSPFFKGGLSATASPVTPEAV
jgi:putative MATE family efflux protein